MKAIFTLCVIKEKLAYSTIFCVKLILNALCWVFQYFQYIASYITIFCTMQFIVYHKLNHIMHAYFVN